MWRERRDLGLSSRITSQDLLAFSRRTTVFIVNAEEKPKDEKPQRVYIHLDRADNYQPVPVSFHTYIHT